MVLGEGLIRVVNTNLNYTQLLNQPNSYIKNFIHLTKYKLL